MKSNSLSALVTRRNVALVLFVSGLLAFHTQLLFTLPIPFPITLVTFAALAMLYADRLEKKDVQFIFLSIGAVCLMSGLQLMTGGSRDIVGSSIYLIISIITAIGVVLTLRAWPRAFTARLFIICALLLVGYALLEAYIPPFKTLSDAFRNWNFAGQMYANDARDMLLHGGVRPKVFAREPSHVGKNFVMASTAWLLLTTYQRKLAVFGGLFVAGFLFIESPMIVIMLLIGACYVIFDPERRYRDKAYRVVRVTLACTFPLAIPIVLLAASSLPLPERFDRLLSGQDASMMVRITGPIQAVPVLLENNPMFGVGFGADEDLSREVLFPFYVELGLPPNAIEHKADNLLHNAIAEFIVGVGVIGSILFGVVIARYVVSATAGSVLFFSVVFLSFCMFLGGFNTIRVWLWFYLLLGVLSVVRSTNIEAQRSTPAPRAATSGSRAARTAL